MRCLCPARWLIVWEITAWQWWQWDCHWAANTCVWDFPAHTAHETVAAFCWGKFWNMCRFIYLGYFGDCWSDSSASMIFTKYVWALYECSVFLCITEFSTSESSQSDFLMVLCHGWHSWCTLAKRNQKILMELHWQCSEGQCVFKLKGEGESLRLCNLTLTHFQCL